MIDTNPWDYSEPNLGRLRENARNAERLSKKVCIERYAGQKAGLMDLLVVSANISTHDGLSFSLNNHSSLLSNFTTGGGADWAIAGSWMCSARARPGELSRAFCTADSLNAATWTLFGVHFRGLDDVDKLFWSQVDYCVTGGDVRPMDDKCALRLSSAILLIVCTLNFCKRACISYTAWLHRQHQKATNGGKYTHSNPKTVRPVCKLNLGSMKLRKCSRLHPIW